MAKETDSLPYRYLLRKSIESQPDKTGVTAATFLNHRFNFSCFL